ncbi:MAG: DUF4079 domain-containing protein [Elainellaceae cyanobacterium]
MANWLRPLLEPIASWFNSLGIPSPIVNWGHPAMMAIVVFVLGSYVGLTGWRIRAVKDAESRKSHKILAPMMSAFMAMGSTGGLLALVMRGEPIMNSPHFWTGAGVLLLLSANAAIALLGFKGGSLRRAHAYIGSTALSLAFLHALFGLKLGLSL